LVSVANALTSIFAGFVVFAYMGYLSKITGQSIDRVIQSGQGLSFIVYPYAVTTLPAAPVWAILFFIMMLLLGMDTMVFEIRFLNLISL
jgi:SNF family Na+-dependent transporter